MSCPSSSRKDSSAPSGRNGRRGSSSSAANAEPDRGPEGPADPFGSAGPSPCPPPKHRLAELTRLRAEPAGGSISEEKRGAAAFRPFLLRYRHRVVRLTNGARHPSSRSAIEPWAGDKPSAQGAR